MATISITVDTKTVLDFNKMARERGFGNGKDYLISWAKGQLASWRAEKLTGGIQQTEFAKLEEAIT